MSLRNIWLYCLLLICATPVVHAQDKWDGVGLEANLLRGKILRHSPKFPTQLPKAVTAVELNAVFQTYGKQDWHKRTNYPIWGFGFMYTDYGIDSIYGKCFGIYPNLQLPLVRYKQLEWTAKLGFGLSYMTKPYERYPNFDTINTAIGSGMNNFSVIATNIRYRLNQHIDIQLGGSFTHVSNAALRTPNLGINTYGAHLGVRYFPTTSQPVRVARDIQPLSNRWLVQARLGAAAREAVAPDGPMYPAYIVSVYASKRYASKYKAFAGFDYSYHTGMYALLRNNEIEVGNERANSWKSAFFFGNEFLVGRVGVVLQLGFYLKNYAIPEDFFYQKLGGNYYIIQKEEGLLKELCASILLKTHKFEAELVEVGIGVGL